MNHKEIVGLFCFDGPLYKDRNGRYCSTTLTDEMFSRFFYCVDKLFVVTRVFEDNRTSEEMNMKFIQNKQIEVIPVGNILSIKGMLWEKKRFEKEIEELVLKSDLIFARMPSIISNSIAKICLDNNKPYLVEVGGCCWDSYKGHGIKGKLMAPLGYYWEKKYVGKAAYATYVTRFFLQQRYPNRNVTTNCSNVYLQEVDEKVQQQRCRKIDEMDVKNPVFGQVVASLDVKYKGEQYFIRAMRKLKEEGIKARFEIVGPGSGEYLINQAKKYGVMDQVELLGAKKKEQVFEWLQSIDVYIQPSKQEGLPRSVIEAMSVGCPCLGSNIAGIPELLDPECMFDPNNNDQIVSAARQLLFKDNLKEKSLILFERSKEYNVHDIEKRRQDVFNQYACSVLKGNNKCER